MKKIKILWAYKEAFIWIAALGFLAFSDPGNHHYTLCPIANMGFDFCPGCGIGRSISFAFRGEFIVSLKTHPLGIAAIILIIYRIIKVLKTSTKYKYVVQ